MTELPLAKLAEALNKAQGTMSGAKKDKKNPFYKSSYADLSSVFDAIREPFAANGLSVTQTMGVLESGRTLLKTSLLHSSGERIDSEMLLPDIADPQKLGSAITYYRRYSLMAIAGIPAEDDDGNAASGQKPQPKPINDNQIKLINDLIGNNENIRQLVLKECNGNIANITIEQFPGAMKWIKDLMNQQEQKND